ncbi:hypothetical protein MKW98_027613 [Papaver atlanticum]|uniref:Uncharacterized protein n=1 Tax=Papaver atlanticum TaxID=357466 RepID=A0AAD4T1R3_9MAGN|nr:hypothetical protein MKW98_027613 [Papaver atlanticum]
MNFAILSREAETFNMCLTKLWELDIRLVIDRQYMVNKSVDMIATCRIEWEYFASTPDCWCSPLLLFMYVSREHMKNVKPLSQPPL